MNTPADLLQKLRVQYEGDINSIITIYREANAAARAYKEVATECLAQGAAIMQTDGVIHHKNDNGACGWTQPQALKLDKDKWAAALARDTRLAQLQQAFDATQAQLEQAQERAGALVLPDRRFYIR